MLNFKLGEATGGIRSLILGLMRKFGLPAIAVLVTMLCPFTVFAFSIQNGHLIESNDNNFIMRGINHAHTWYTDSTTQALSDIANTGANTVRVVLSTGAQFYCSQIPGFRETGCRVVLPPPFHSTDESRCNFVLCRSVFIGCHAPVVNACNKRG